MSILRTDKIAGLDSVSAITGSVKFTSDAGAGQGTYLEVNDPDGTIKFGTGEFSIEFWMYANTTDTSEQENDLASILDYGYGSSNDTTGAWFALHQEDRTLHFGFNNANQVQSSNFLNANTWHHIAIQRQGGNTKIYGDGTQVATVADTHDYTDALTTRTLQIGSQAASGVERNFDGYISNLRICKGHAVYNGAFTPPTRALEVHPGPDDDRTVVFCCHSSQDAYREETGKTIVLGTLSKTPGPLASTFVPDVGNDHTHGTVLEGGTAFSSLNYMTLPRGDTSQRGRGRGVIMGGYLSPIGYLQDIYYVEIQSTGNAFQFGDLTASRYSGGGCGSSTRGLIGGGRKSNGDRIDIIESVEFATTSNSIDFGDLVAGNSFCPGGGNQTRGIWMGGTNGSTTFDTIQYVAISTLGNAQDFGDLRAGSYAPATAASPTRMLAMGGGDPSSFFAYIDFIEIATTGNAADFGDMSTNRNQNTGVSSNTRAVAMGGNTPSGLSNVMEFVTIATTGNATDFGDLTAGVVEHTGSVNNSIRGVQAGGRYPSYSNILEYIAIATTGNSADFGDIPTTGIGYVAGASDSHGGLT